MNNNFIELIRLEKPDYIFFWLIYDEFSIDTFNKIREISPKTKLINFFGDDDTRFDIHSRYYSLFIDFPLISQKNYLKEYHKAGIVVAKRSIETSKVIRQKSFRVYKCPTLW